MKKIILTVAMAAAMLTVKAQETPKTSTTDMEVSTQMKKDLQLNDNQFQQVQTINQKKMERRREIESMYASDPATREVKMSETDQEADAELSGILSDKQYNAYLELQGRSSSVTELDTMPVESTLDVSIQDGAKTKIKSDKQKSESGSQEIKMKDDEMKMKDASGKLKVEGEEEKYKSDDTKYKSEPGETKLKQGDDKMKAKEDKVKIESGDKKVKIEKDKTLIKSSDSKYKVKH